MTQLTPKGESDGSISSVKSPQNTQRVSDPIDVMSALKDRARLNAVQTRQTLGAVGRVASRVRSSGLLKVSAILPKARDEDESVDSSPWGVGTAAISKSYSVSVTAEPESKQKSYIYVPNGMKKNSDVLDMSSPLSAYEQFEHQTIEKGLAGTPKSQRGQIAKMDQPTSPIGTRSQSPDVERPKGPESGHPLRQIPSSAVRPKFTFRPSLLIEATSPPSCDGNSTSPIGPCSQRFSYTSKSPTAQTTFSNEPVRTNAKEKDASASSPSFSVHEKHIPDASYSPKVAFHSETSISLPQVAAGEQIQDKHDKREEEKSIKLACFGVFGRSKSRPQEGVHRRKSKAGKENPFLKLRLTRGKSQPAKSPSPPEGIQRDIERNDEQQTLRGSLDEAPPTQKYTSVPKTRRNFWKTLLQTETNWQRGTRRQSGNAKPRDDPDEKVVSVAPDFFAKATENGRAEMLEVARTDHTVGKALKSRNGLAIWKKAPKKLETEEKGDDVLGSDDEETINETIVRSLAVDDFISYQTRRKKKGQ